MKHKTEELEGALLDAAVAIAVGEDPTKVQPLRYSRSWRDAGPIIERERISLMQPEDSGDWQAGIDPYAAEGRCYSDDQDPPTVQFRAFRQSGPTPLIAAMRAFVASKLGEEVEL